jgi:hypothetical protein
MLMLKFIVTLICATILASCNAAQEKPDRFLHPDGTVIDLTEAAYKPVRVEGQVATAAERAACEKVGGEIMRDGMAGFERCTQTYSDAGKACSDASDCIGSCRGTGKMSDFGSTVVGECQTTDSPFGCFQEVENGKVTAALCVD